jgi:hypothetical protein
LTRLYISCRYWETAGQWQRRAGFGQQQESKVMANFGVLQYAPSHSIAATFLLDPYYVSHPITNDAANQPHWSEYLRSLPTLKGFNRDFPPTSKFTPCQQRVFIGFVIFVHSFLPVRIGTDMTANAITKIYDVI